MLLLAVLLALSNPSPAQSDWQPPRLELARLSAIVGAAPVHPAVLEGALPRVVAKDFRGLGAEAARAGSWAKGKSRVALRGSDGSWSLADDSGASLSLSPALGSALRHANEYFMMTPATMERPVRHEELKAALLSEAGVSRVRAIFERSIAERVQTGKGVAIPELGGEATLEDGVLDLHEMADLTRPVMDMISRSARDPEALARIASEHSEAFKVLDEMGLLSRLLGRLPELEAKGVSREKRDNLLALTVETVLENGAGSYVWDPETQFAAVADQSWSGRYVGKWHTHPPGAGKASWDGSGGPSGPDLDIAVKDGQNLVLSFQTDGFDVYDLSPLENAQPDLRKVLEFSYRSEAWRLHFQAIHDELFPKPRS